MNSGSIVSIVSGAILLVISVAIIMTFSGSLYDPNSDWEYGDYRLAQDVESVDGPLEIVQYDGNYYVHAVGTGAGTIAYSDGTEEHITINRATLYVLLLAGQSNAAYYYGVDVDVANSDLERATDMGYYYGTETSPVYANYSEGIGISYKVNQDSLGIHEATNPDGSYRIGNLEAPFISEFSKRGKCLIINTGINASPIEPFVPPNGVSWEYTQSYLEDALSKIDNQFEVILGGLIWIQGEYNSSTEVSSYVEDWHAFNEALEDLFPYQHGYIVQTRGGNAATAQAQIVSTDADLTLVQTQLDFSTDDGTMQDSVHYSQTGLDILGKEIGAEYAAIAVGPDRNAESLTRTLVSIVPIMLVAGFIIGIGYKLFTRRDSI